MARRKSPLDGLNAVENFFSVIILRIDGIRRAELDGLVAGIDAILFSQAIDAEGAVVFAKAREMGLEGNVSKRLGAPYWSGRVKSWLKIKNPDFRRR